MERQEWMRILQYKHKLEAMYGAACEEYREKAHNGTPERELAYKEGAATALRAAIKELSNAMAEEEGK